MEQNETKIVYGIKVKPINNLWNKIVI